LQAAIARAPPINTIVTNFRTMITPPFWIRNNHG